MKKMFNSNLFHESRLVFRAEGPGKAPESTNVPSVKEADSKRDIGTEVARTEEKVSHILKSLDGLKKPTGKTEKMKEHAIKIREKLNKLNEKGEELTLQTLDKLNSTFDNNIQGFRIQVLKDILQSSVKDIENGNVDSLITAFALLKSDDSPLSIPNSGYSIQRRGHLLVLEHKGGWKSMTGEKMPNEKITFQVSLVGDKWQIQDAEGKKLPEKFTSTQNPIAGAVESKLGAWKFYSSGQTKLNYEPVAKPAQSAPDVRAAKPKEKKENVEKYDAVKVAEAFKFVHEASGPTQDMPNDLFKALKDFINTKENSFNKNGVTAYIRSNGSMYRIAVESGGTSTVQYLRREGNRNKIGNANGKALGFPSDPISSQMNKKDLESGVSMYKSKTKEAPIVGENPDPEETRDYKQDETYKIIKEGDRIAHEDYKMREEMKPWFQVMKRELAVINKNLKTYDGRTELLENIKKETPNLNEAVKIAAKFINRCEQLERDLVLEEYPDPEKMISRAKDIASILPPEIGKSYANAFMVRQGENRLARFKKQQPGAEGSQMA